MGKIAERSLELKKNFLSEREKGMSFKQMADKYHLSTHTVYAIKEIVAKEMGVNPDSLLYFPGRGRGVRNFVPSTDTVDTKKIIQDIENLDTEICRTLDNIYSILSTNNAEGGN